MSNPRLPTCGQTLVLAGLTLVLTGCGLTPTGPRVSDRVLGVITPYRVDVVQGNVVTREMVERVRTGMSRSQVRELLGSPLIADAFHENRWDYVFTIRRAGTAYQQRRVTAIFRGDALETLESDELPSERDFVESIDTGKSSGKPPVLELSEAQLRALPAPKAAAPAAPALAPAKAASGPSRTFPPLEQP